MTLAQVRARVSEIRALDRYEIETALCLERELWRDVLEYVNNTEGNPVLVDITAEALKTVDFTRTC